MYKIILFLITTHKKVVVAKLTTLVYKQVYESVHRSQVCAAFLVKMVTNIQYVGKHNNMVLMFL